MLLHFIPVFTEYHRRVAQLGEMFENFKSRIASEMVPAINILIDGFAQLFSSMTGGSTIIDVLKGAFEELIEYIVRVVGLVKYAADAVAGAFELIGKVAGALAATIMSLRHPFTELPTVVSESMADIKNSFNASAAQLDRDANAVNNTIKNLRDSFDGLNEVQVTAKKINPEPISPPLHKPKGKDTELEAIALELEEAKKGSQEKIDLAEQYASRSAEVYKGDAVKAIEAYKKVYEAYKEYNTARLSEQEAGEKALNAVQNASFEEALKLLEANHAAHKDDANYLQEEIALIRAKEAVNNEYYDNLIRLDSDNVTKRQKDVDEQVKMQQKAAADILAAQSKAAKEVEAQWQAITKPMETAFDTAIQGMISGTMTFQKAFKTMMDTVVKDIFGSSINTMVHNWVSGENARTEASIVGEKIRAALHLSAATQSKAVDASTAQAGIQAKAADAGAGAASSVASIPFVGPALALAAMAATEAAVMALIGKIASAEGGMMVGHDQLAAVHKDEMILPRHISQGIQERILSQEEPKGSGSGGDTYHIHAHDAQSFEKYLGKQRNRNALVNAAKQSFSNGGVR